MPKAVEDILFFDCLADWLYPNLDKMAKVYYKHVSPPPPQSTYSAMRRRAKLIEIFKNGEFYKKMYIDELCSMFNMPWDRLRFKVRSKKNTAWYFQGDAYKFSMVTNQ